MAYEMKENTGSLFKNDKKTSENHPSVKGSALIGGVEYWISAWTKLDKNGNKWQSLSFQRKDEAKQFNKESERKENAPTGFDDLDNDLPF